MALPNTVRSEQPHLVYQSSFEVEDGDTLVRLVGSTVWKTIPLEKIVAAAKDAGITCFDLQAWAKKYQTTPQVMCEKIERRAWFAAGCQRAHPQFCQLEKGDWVGMEFDPSTKVLVLKRRPRKEIALAKAAPPSRNRCGLEVKAGRTYRFAYPHQCDDSSHVSEFISIYAKGLRYDPEDRKWDMKGSYIHDRDLGDTAVPIDWLVSEEPKRK